MSINRRSAILGSLAALVGAAVAPSAVANETQHFKIAAEPTGGTFTISACGKTTKALQYNASAATIEKALSQLSNNRWKRVTLEVNRQGRSSYVISY